MCRFPSELCTLHNHRDLFVISEDDLAPVLCLPSWHFELLYRLLPLRWFLGVCWVLCFGGWFAFLPFSVGSQPGW